jgi:hypothetical protein
MNDGRKPAKPAGRRLPDRGVGALLNELANKDEAIVFTPFAQCILDGNLFVCMPGIQQSRLVKQ